MSDPLLDRIAQLPHATVPAHRAHATQARCHRVLARRAKRHDVSRRRRWPSWSPALIGLATVYFADAIWHVMRAYGAR